MEQMKNTFILYDKDETDDFIYSDYTSRPVRRVFDLPESSDSNYIDYKVIQDNDLIEGISQDLYGSPDFWDILILINENDDPLFSMPYDYDVLTDISTSVIEKYISDYSGVYKQATMDELKTNYLANLEKKNETESTIKIIKPEKLYDFIKIVREYFIKENI